MPKPTKLFVPSTPTYELDGKSVDGTTIFIVAPRPLGWGVEMERIELIRWQVWPKRVAGVREDTDIADMTFKLDGTTTLLNSRAEG